MRFIDCVKFVVFEFIPILVNHVCSLLAPSVLQTWRYKFNSCYCVIGKKFRGILSRTNFTRVLIYTDSLPVQNQKESVEKAVKQVCRAELGRGFPFCLHHHPSSSNAWLQVADYCAWALARKWEQGDTRTYDVLRQNLACDEMDVLAKGNEFYY